MSALWNAGSALLLGILNFFYDLFHSYGIAIILLTVAVRVLLHPLSHKQLVSMQKMQKLQPRLKVLQEKFAGDKERLNKETMTLYKENNVNPAAGCLPLLVQLPILILLFRVLMDLNLTGYSFLGVHLDRSVYGALGSALGITDPNVGLMAIVNAIGTNPGGLSQVGLYLGNVLLMAFIGYITWFQQQLTGASNPQMAFMNWFMPIFLVFICLSLPGGVLLYWAVSSLIGVVQQWWVHRRTDLEMQEKPALFKEKPPVKAKGE